MTATTTSSSSPSTTLLFQSWIATSVSNLNGSRVRNASLEKRHAGWTEDWNDTVSPTSTIGSSSTTSTIQLVQFRPAWYEQLILSMMMQGIRFTVTNSPYAATESTGPLPYLRHDVVLVGGSGNNIVQYLKQQYKKDWTLDPPTEELQAQAHLITSLVETQLNPALQVLRFSNDEYDAWNQVHRPQYIAAGQSSSNAKSWSLGSKFQAWSIRVVAQQQQNNMSSVQQAKKVLQECYSTLEGILGVASKSTSKSSTKYMLGTATPTVVDALVGAHLLEALSDVYAVTILSEYPQLVQLAQHLHVTYLNNTTTMSEDWQVANAQENAANAFVQEPLLLVARRSNAATANQQMSHALQVMQSLRPTFQTVLEQARQVRRSRQEEPPKEERLDLFYTWRMGGTTATPTGATNNKPKEDQTAAADHQKWRETHKTNDELWITSVLALTALAVVFGTREK